MSDLRTDGPCPLSKDIISRQNIVHCPRPQSTILFLLFQQSEWWFRLCEEEKKCFWLYDNKITYCEMRNLHCYWVSLFDKHFYSLVVVSMMMVVVCLEGKMSSLQFRTYRRVGFNTAPLPTSDRGRGLTRLTPTRGATWPTWVRHPLPPLPLNKWGRQRRLPRSPL